MNSNRLLDMYQKAVFQPALSEGEYTVRMTKHEYVEHKTTPYIKITLVDVNSNREITDNKFEKGFGVMVSHLRQQLGREDEAIQPVEFFNELIKNKVEFKIWVVKRTIDGRQRTNVNFLEPIAETVPNTKVVDDE